MTYSDDPVIIDFKTGFKFQNWTVVDDVVMGGESEGNLYINEKGNAVFEGIVSLDNSGGFSSVRYRFDEKNVESYSWIILRVKGDGKTYQFRVKTSLYDRHSYAYEFSTNGSWQKIRIPLADMYPTWRGMTLKADDYPAERMEEIAILIGNKKAEQFKLEIDSISLK
jgi:hypothetical protein